MVKPKTMTGIISDTIGVGRKKNSTFNGAISSITINNVGESATDIADVKTDVTDLKQNLGDSGEVSDIKADIADVKADILELKQHNDELNQGDDEFHEKLVKHIATSDNVFSIDNVNTLDNAYIRCMNKLNFTLNLIHENKTEITASGEYASVLRPIFEKKYTDNAISIDGYVVIETLVPSPRYCYFFESVKDNDNKQQLSDPVQNEQRLTSSVYDETNELREKYPQQSMFYVINWYKWADSVKVTFSICIPDILKPGGPWIRILSGVNITPYFPSIVSIDLLPQTYKTYLGKLQDAFNNYVKADYDPLLATIYQFGKNEDFNKLKVVSSKEYPLWNGDLITNAYIPGSNVDMPTIMYQINIQLNRQYTGMSDGEIVIVSYDIGHVYYIGVIKMLYVDGYDGL